MAQVTRESALAAARLWNEAKSGNARAQFAVAESISQGDFPSQIAPLIRRTLQQNFLAPDDSVYDRWTSKETVQYIDVDEQVNSYGFSQDNVPGVNMGDTFIPGTLPNIANREKYPQLTIQASGKTKRATTFGEAFGIDWQAIVNLRGTNVNLVDDAISAFALHARNHQDAYPVAQLVNAAGIRTDTLGTTGHAMTGNPDLTQISTIQAAIAQAQGQTIDGVPAYFQKFALLVSPAQVPIVKQTLSTVQVTQVPARTGAGSTAQSVQYNQVIDLGVEIDVVPQKWITAINPSLGKAWFLVPVGGPRPVVTRNYLAGYETPGFWVKDGNAKNYNGGDVPFLDGDFDSDAIQTKTRWAYGASTLWNQGVIYSTGANA